MESNKNFCKTNGFIKEVKMKNNEKGIALITTMVLGFIALGFIGALLYVLTSGTNVSSMEKRYTTALEAAKGGAELIISNLFYGTLTCNNGNPCQPCPTPETDPCSNNFLIDIKDENGNITSDIGGYQLKAYYLSEETTITASIYAIRVKAVKSSSKEKAIIEFVYKLE